jgi:serine/threonine protein kinase
MSDARVLAFVREGRHEEAAALLVSAGKRADAASLLAQGWKYPEAVSLALESERPHEAYTHAVLSLQAALVEQALEGLSANAEASKRAADFAESKGRLREAAVLRRSAGELAVAATLFEQAGELGLAARLHEATGDFRKAGMLYEKRMTEAPEDGSSALALGRILLGFGRNEHALRALQRAAVIEETALLAAPFMLRALVNLGMRDAAGEVLDKLRVNNPELPVDVDAAVKALVTSALVPETGTSELLLGRYKVEATLGAGGSGRVLRAHDMLSMRAVAVKVLSTARGAQGRDALARFAKEAQVAAGIDHPNVVEVFDYLPDGPLLVMELMSGGTLESRLQEGVPTSPLFARHVVRSVLQALEAVHRRGVIHRDLKPANIFFGPGGEVKVGDFGVAHLTDAQATLTGAMMGTLAYMAPEQITGEGNPDASTDLYALGVVFHRLLTGSLPFPGPDFVAQHLGDTPPLLSTSAPWLDASFDSFVHALLAKENEARPRSASDVLLALEALGFRQAEEAFELARATSGLQVPRRATMPPSGSNAPSNTPASLGTRYVPKGMVDIGVGAQRGRLATHASDALLGRDVAILEVTPDELTHFRKLAKIVSPFLPLVLFAEESTVILEWPQGQRASRKSLSMNHMGDLGEALEALEKAGVSHGAVEVESILVGPARTLLLLPLLPSTTPIEEDRRALARLFGMRA